ncbi:maleylpyruvate isomerase family mycothiol-dependent enzyme [Arthrobacter gallicola]|nr:maleylpyruvate isomerase family mycothiol-dependent enzyme [Arthrobacter gallicola]
MLLATATSLSEDEMACPSLCEGWTRADVLAHIAGGSRTLTQLVDEAVYGRGNTVSTPGQAQSPAASNLAGLPRVDLLEELRGSAEAFAQQAERLGGELAAPEVRVDGKSIPSTSIVALRISEVVVHHHDLDTAWTIEEADPDSLLNALEAVVRVLRAKGAPGMTLVTEERDEWTIGNGGQRILSDREGLLQWLARGDSQHIEVEGPVPALPSW